MKKKLITLIVASLTMPMMADLPTSNDYISLNNVICGNQGAAPGKAGAFVKKPLFVLVGEDSELTVHNAPRIRYTGISTSWPYIYVKETVNRAIPLVGFGSSGIVATDNFRAVPQNINESTGLVLSNTLTNKFSQRGISIISADSYFDYDNTINPFHEIETQLPAGSSSGSELAEEVLKEIIWDFLRGRGYNPIEDMRPINEISELFPLVEQQSAIDLASNVPYDITDCDVNYVYSHTRPTIGQLIKPNYATKLTPGTNRFTASGGSVDSLSRNAQSGVPVQYKWVFSGIDYNWSFSKITTTPYVDVPLQYGGQHEASVVAFDGTFESDPAVRYFLVNGPRQCDGLACRSYQ